MITKRSSSPKSTFISVAELQQRIKRIYDHLYANAPVRTAHGIASEVGKILHTALYKESKQNRLFMDDEFIQPAFEFTHLEVKRLLRCEDSLCIEVAEVVRNSFSSMNAEWQLYKVDESILLRDSDIAFTCAELSGVVVSDRRRDVFGDALEIFRGQWAKRTSGQFFTDQRVTSLAMKLIEFDPRRGDDLIDLCAGTGGFLLAGLNHIRILLEQSGDLSETLLVDLASKSLKGQEIDSDVCEIANASLSFRVSKTDHQFVYVADSLLPIEDPMNNKHGISYNTHVCAATNPPFGTKITIKSTDILKQFDLARNAYKLSNRAPDILFIEQNVRLLKPGEGRLAIVVPYQILSGPQTQFVREWILRHTHLIAVIDLPADTFQPHTGTKACLLVIKRRLQPIVSISEIEESQVFMSIPRWIGHDRRGNPVYRRSPNGVQTEEILSDFEEVAWAFELFQQEKDPVSAHIGSFSVSTKSILDDPQLRLNAFYYHRTPINEFAENRTDIEWYNVKLQDVVQDIFFPTRFKRNYVDHYEGAIPFLGGSNISQLVLTTDKWLRHDDPKLDELKVKPGWLLITRSGTTGIVSSVPSSWDGFALSEHIIRIIPDDSKLPSAYLDVFLRTKFAQDALARGKFGSVIDEINPEYIGQIDIWIPKSEILLGSIIEKANNAQRAREVAIDSLLEAVDDINRTLQIS